MTAGDAAAPLRRLRAGLAALVAVFLAVGRVEWLLRRRPLDVACRALGVALVLDAGPATVAPIRLSAEQQRRLRWAAKVLAMAPVPDTCLRRALVAGVLLPGRDRRVRLGVAPAQQGTAVPAGYDLHAWLEVDGASLDASAARFAALTSRPG